ncbi:peptidyl-prolyl cis-trans isomerase SurA [Candidatus Kinetoplastibacterium blastocrithidii TCC012E]|uniref:Chaperone SurA n=3 Tax=Candidatus Kinetoplastidibacterium blastocrithidiae TaxID=233181 RepID=M1MCN4_9PROT|nr:peptidylprolyl isomerase [Candidatus Kinetoplastibacterium blastocrithidii]AFZ83459.1 hypothetical protein CKBE_00270 [Candidatus Kinetoplastibacterium blastocrithidii (ex Strigomonas culicis)]AGF49555.1 peptidyl-prolyl cis-trans isomerase SurA [Candidatus Kinetoplastibacterium blastocrithidii TCC012E]
MQFNKIILIVSYVLIIMISPFIAFADELIYEDKIIAIVNKDIIKLSDLVKVENCFINNLLKSSVHIPDKFVLRAQLLNQMIDCELIRQESNKIGIFVDDNKLNTVISDMASDCKLSLDLFRSKIEKDDSIPWDVYLYNIRNAIYFNTIKQHLVEEKMKITDLDVENFLSDLNKGNKCHESFLQNRKSYKNLYSLSQVLLKPPQNFSGEMIDDSCEILKEIQAKLRAGEKFDDLRDKLYNNPYLSFTDFLGTKPLNCWPEVFINAIENLSVGEVSEIFRSPSGFHIIKVLDIIHCNNEDDDVLSKKFHEILIRKKGDSVIQREIQHILIKPHQIINEEEIINNLEKIRLDMLSGNISFEDMARKYSEDITASQGGSMGWVAPGHLVRELDNVINKLDPGQISGVIKSQYGYHLVKVNDIRSKDIFDENKRIRAKEYLIELNSQYIFDNWLNNLKKCSFIENRLMD